MRDDMMRERGALPPGWMWTALGDATYINPRDPSIRALPDSLLVSFAPMAAVDAEQGAITTPEVKPLSNVRKGFTAFADGDVLFAKITPCMENGKAAIASGLVGALGFGSTEFHVLRPKVGVSPEWIFHFIRQTSFRRAAQAHFAGTAGQLRVPSSFLESYEIPLPPLPEQRRIVAEIEKQFTRLDAGVAALKRVQANLKRYRASVLKAACEGRLAPQDPNDEQAERLLVRILAERRAKWEAEHPGKRYVEPAAPPPDGLAVLPAGWCWATVDQSIQVIDYRGRTPPFSDNGIPHLRSSNVRGGKIIWEGLRYVTEETYDQYMTRGIPENGDLLFTTEAPLGEVAPAPQKRFSLAQRLMILRPAKVLLQSDFLMYQIMSEDFQARLQFKETGSTVTGVSSRNFRPLPIRVPPLPEQHRIVAELERRLSVVAELEAMVVANLARAGRLRQAVLKRAFEGRLTPLTA